MVFPSGSRYISGWLTAFAVFDENGNWTDEGQPRKQDTERVIWPQINIEKIPTGIVNVDLKLFDNAKQYESVMFAGHIGYNVLEDNCTLQPKIGWAIALKLTANEVEEAHQRGRSE